MCIFSTVSRITPCVEFQKFADVELNSCESANFHPLCALFFQKQLQRFLIPKSYYLLSCVIMRVNYFKHTIATKHAMKNNTVD